MKTILEAIETKWDTPGDGNKAADVRVFARFYKWTDKADHSLGFTQLGEIDLSHNLQRDALPGITEEIENDIDPNEAAYGTIKASQVNIEFADEIGTLYKRILTEDDPDNLYKYNGDAVHKWSIVVKIGDAASDNWIEFEYIYGWLFDPDNQDIPRWAGVGEPTPQKFNVAAFTLLKWLGDIGSAFLGDYRNRSGWYDYTDDDNHEDKIYTDVCNYPLLPVVRKILNESGIKDDNIQTLHIPPDLGIVNDFSSLEWKARPDAYGVPTGEIPGEFHWKTVVSGDDSIDYFVWHPGWTWLGFQGLQVTALNRTTGGVETTTTGALNTSSYRIRRLWYPGSGNDCYVLTEDSTNAWRILKLTLSGDIDNLSMTIPSSGAYSNAVTMTMPPDKEVIGIEETFPWERYYLQCDLDFTEDELWAALVVEYYDDDMETPVRLYDYQIGYWDLSDGSWVGKHYQAFVNDFTDYSYTFVCPNDGSKLGGFRCLRGANNQHGIACFVLYVEGEATSVILRLSVYDEATDTWGGDIDYDYTGQGQSWYAHKDSRYPLTGGRGSIGGFVFQGIFYFQLASHDYFEEGVGSADRKSEWFYWTNGVPAGWTGTTVSESNQDYYRSFSSHGSAALEYSTGYTQLCPLGLIGVGSSYYYINIYPTIFHMNITPAPARSRDLTYGKMRFGFKRNFEAETGDHWPILGAPSVSQYSKYGGQTEDDDDIAGKPFVIYRYKHTFLTVLSLEWFQNFAFDFETANPSLADVLRDIAKALGLIMKIGHDTTIIRPRNDITDADKVITPALYVRNAQKVPQVSGYDKVELTTSMDSSEHTAGKTGAMARVLSVDTDFVLPNRGDKRAAGLYDAWKDNKLKIILDCRNQSLLEPGDIVDLHLIIPPGGKGYTDGEDAVNAIVIRITNKGMRTQLEAISVAAASSIPV